MSKVSVPITNDLCPQTLFTYGTFREDGQPNFGLFCWFSYCWFDELGVMCAIGGHKQTQDRILANRVFSANRTYSMPVSRTHNRVNTHKNTRPQSTVAENFRIYHFNRQRFVAEHRYLIIFSRNTSEIFRFAATI